MKVIDLLNKIANGEIDENTIIEFENGYKDYCSIRVYFDRYIVDKENLNYEVEIIKDKPFNKRVEEIYNRHIDYIYDKEDKKIEKLDIQLSENQVEMILEDKINEIIDYINKE